MLKPVPYADGAAEPVTVFETATSVFETSSTLWLDEGAVVAVVGAESVVVADPDAVVEAEPEAEEPEAEADAEAEAEAELVAELEEPLAVHPSPEVMMSMLSHEPVLSPNLYSQAGL